MSDTRNIRSAGEEVGELNLRRLSRMLERGELEQPVEYWSEKTARWEPVAGIMNDFDEGDRAAGIRESGVAFCRVSGAGCDDECPACRALLERKFPIDEAPALPPSGCTCIPWCRCCLVATE